MQDWPPPGPRDRGGAESFFLPLVDFEESVRR
jgi:hypothetical protein